MIYDSNKLNASCSFVTEDAIASLSCAKPVQSVDTEALKHSAVAMTEQVVRDGTVRNPTEVRTLVNYLLG